MITESDRIFSSTGSLGVSRRQDSRVYANATRYSGDPAEVERNFRRLCAISDNNPGRISRSVFRGVVSGEVVDHIRGNGMEEFLEVALPLDEFRREPSWLVYTARNQPGREQIVPRDEMIGETSPQQASGRAPLERVQDVVGRGYVFVDRIADDQVDGILAMWGPTFGWERQEIINLQRRLRAGQSSPPSARNVWFSAIEDEGVVVSVAMAERLTVPAADGQLDLVESTEWRTQDAYANQGLMSANVAALNAQILEDLSGSPNGLPVILAECNYATRSDRAGNGAGFMIPDRSFAPQIIVQNVRVGDGQPIPAEKLRDFSFMVLPAGQIQESYDPIKRDAIMQSVRYS